MLKVALLFAIVALLPAVYGLTGITAGNLLGKSFRFVSKNYPGHYMRHRGYQMWLDKYHISNLYSLDSYFDVVPGLAGIGISLRSKNYPAYYIRHAGYLCYIGKNDGSDLFKKDASWIPKNGLADPYAVSFESVNYRHYYMRHQGYRVKISKYIRTTLYLNDATWYPIYINEVGKVQEATNDAVEEFTKEEEEAPVENKDQLAQETDEFEY